MPVIFRWGNPLTEASNTISTLNSPAGPFFGLPQMTITRKRASSTSYRRTFTNFTYAILPVVNYHQPTNILTRDWLSFTPCFYELL